MNKARKALIRERDKQQRLRDEAELSKRADELKSMVGGFARKGSKANLIKPPVFTVSSRVEPFLPAKVDRFTQAKVEPRLQKSVAANLERRDLAAQNKLLELKSRVAPVYNKGGYQYLIDSDLEDLQKGNTRRRS